MKYLANVVSLKLDFEKCLGCGRCLGVCPHGVFSMENRKAVILDRDACMECGACQQNCPHGALTVSAGVGCAYAILSGMLHKTAPSCSCSESESSEKGRCCG